MRTILGLGLALALATAGVQAQSPADVANGARVWANNCTRCHNARASTERTDGEWLTIIAHMRARGNLTRTDATLVAAFMRATNVPEAVAAAAPEASEPAPDPEGEGEGEGSPAIPLDVLIRYLKQIRTP